MPAKVVSRKVRDPPVLGLCSRRRALPARGKHRLEADVASSALTTASAGRRGSARVGADPGPHDVQQYQGCCVGSSENIWKHLQLFQPPLGQRCRYMVRARMEEQN